MFDDEIGQVRHLDEVVDAMSYGVVSYTAATTAGYFETFEPRHVHKLVIVVVSNVAVETQCVQLCESEERSQR